ncbi:hypothetical protein N7539_002972 [Penicillium diatomitis]|uniref:non-specific serine/threonine protein kinase n=1 Tax=Penicillium diatomitis TaxID=2819901 RepID=A0A9W9XFP2_9EURO|nr:uncharacterized protein N7539_002972 [Penicillium diatomitis]KAJ5491405.1 hypothetical protein N7539_002972 [Penicillium diatomitis]
MKEENRRHYDAWTMVTSQRPNMHSEAAHNHHLTRQKWASTQYQDHGRPINPIFQNNNRPSMASVSTVNQPLLQQSTISSPTYATIPKVVDSHRPFSEKYGRCLEILHYGNSSTVRLHQIKLSTYGKKSRQLFAVKVYRFHNNIVPEPNSQTRESCCPASVIADLHPRHPNILAITEILHNERGELCLVMPFCAGGDLYELLSRSGPLATSEADCIIAQILGAVSFLHENGTAHRDLRLETVLLTQQGSIKMAGFGDEHVQRLWKQCAIAPADHEQPHDGSLDDPGRPQRARSWSFSLPWMVSPFNQISSTKGANGGDAVTSTASSSGVSSPYIAPEGYSSSSRRPSYRESIECEEDEEDGEGYRDPRPADVWATAVIYMALITGRLLWRSARPHREDAKYLEYLHCRREEDGYPPIEALGKVSLKTIICPVRCEASHEIHSGTT